MDPRPAAEVQREQEAERRIAEGSKEMRKRSFWKCGKCGWNGDFVALDHTTGGADCPKCGALAMSPYPGDPPVCVPVTTSANAVQVGGSHYKREDGGEEHWDRVARLRLDYYQAQITKYVERAKLKNGVQDLKTAQHFLQKYLELIAEGKVEGYESSGGVAAMMQKPGVPDPEVKHESK